MNIFKNAKLVSSSFLAATLSLFATFSTIAADKSVDLGSVLGKDGNAFAKCLAVEFKVLKTNDHPRTHAKGYCMLTADVPTVGAIMLLTDNQKEDGAIKHMKVWFTDKTISTWQAAFAKLGIPSEGVKEEQKENYVAVTLAPIGGKAWRGYFYAKHSDDEQGRPCLALGIPK